LHGVVVTQVQDPACGLVEPHTVGLGPSIQSVQIPLQSLPALEQIDTSSQLGVFCKLTLRVLSSLIQIVIKMLNKTRPKAESWGTQAVTGHKLDLTPLTTTLCAWPFSQFFIQQRRNTLFQCEKHSWGRSWGQLEIHIFSFERPICGVCRASSDFVNQILVKDFVSFYNENKQQ